MKYIFKIVLILGILFTFTECETTPPISCEDGIMNQDEEGVDCGGPCAPCNGGFSCSDGIRNGTEIGVDCGGECLPCFPAQNLCFDGIQNGGEEGIDCGGPCSLPCNFCNPSQDNVVYGMTYDISDCEYDSFNEVYEVIGRFGINGPTLTVKIASPNTPPAIGAYIVRSTSIYSQAISIRIDYFTGQNLYAVEGQSVYIVDNNPLEIILCDINFSGEFDFTATSRIICN